MSLRSESIHGTKWSGISVAIVSFLQFATYIILARLLQATDFGLMAMLMVFFGFAQIYIDLGISNAIIYKQDVTSGQLSSLYWLTVVAGILVYLAILLLSPLIVLIYHEPRLNQLIPLAALSLLIIPFGQQFMILLQKELRFKAIAVAEITSSVASLLVAVSLAWFGYGVYSIIWGQVANAGIKTILLIILGLQRWRPSFYFAREGLGEYIRFGLYQLGERSINYFSTRVDQLLIGIMLGPNVLGLYNLAFNLVITPCSRLNQILTRVIFPVFSKISNESGQLKKWYLYLLRMLITISAPMLFGISAIAVTFVPVILGQRWLGAAILMQILAFVALFRSVANPIGALLLSQGRADLGFIWNACIFLLQIIGLFLGVKLGGIKGIALALLVLQIVYFIPAYKFLIKKIIGSCFLEYVMNLIPIFVFSSIMYLPLYLLSTLLKPSFILLMSEVVCGICLYIGLIILFRSNDLFQIKNIFQEMIFKNA